MQQMKKVMMLAMLMAVMVAAHAASPVTVVSSSKTFLRDNAKAVVTFSWDDAYAKLFSSLGETLAGL